MENQKEIIKISKCILCPFCIEVFNGNFYNQCALAKINNKIIDLKKNIKNYTLNEECHLKKNNYLFKI